MSDDLPIDGAPHDRFRLYRADINGEAIGVAVAKFKTLEEMRSFKRRLDWLYVEYDGHNRIRAPARG